MFTTTTHHTLYSMYNIHYNENIIKLYISLTNYYVLSVCNIMTHNDSFMMTHIIFSMSYIDTTLHSCGDIMYIFLYCSC